MLIALKILLIVISLMLCGIILLQPGKGEGIASAFGGVGTESFFGTKVHQHMNRFTIVLSILFLGLAVAINLLATRETSTRAPEKSSAPAENK